MIKTSTKTLTGNSYTKKVTIYRDESVVSMAAILYFHGGGLLYGSREDLPELHLTELTREGYVIIAFDYPLAPGMMLDGILKDAVDSVNDFCMHKDTYLCTGLPYFLFGRSAGSYLALLTVTKGELISEPLGLISYYGYGFLCDGWYDTENEFYNTLPIVSDSDIQSIGDGIYTYGPLETHYNIYVYARQTGKWKNLIFRGRDKDFLLNYSLRVDADVSCPMFCAHSIGDPDVPYEEFLKLCELYRPERFISTQKVHDFDRLIDSPDTIRLLTHTKSFLKNCLN